MSLREFFIAKYEENSPSFKLAQVIYSCNYIGVLQVVLSLGYLLIPMF